MKRNWTFLLSGGVVLALVAAAAVSRFADPGRPTVLAPVLEAARSDRGVALRPGDPTIVAVGRGVYGRACASCHGERLEGQANWQERKPDGRLPAPPHDPSGHTWHHPDEQLFLLTKHGPAALIGNGYQSDMPAYEGVLTDAEIVAVLSYIKSTWPAEIRARHDDINRRAAGG